MVLTTPLPQCTYPHEQGKNGQEHMGSWQDPTSLSPDPTQNVRLTLHHKKRDANCSRVGYTGNSKTWLSQLVPRWFSRLSHHACNTAARLKVTHPHTTKSEERKDQVALPPPFLRAEGKFPRSPQQPHWAICITCLYRRLSLARRMG